MGKEAFQRIVKYIDGTLHFVTVKFASGLIERLSSSLTIHKMSLTFIKVDTSELSPELASLCFDSNNFHKVIANNQRGADFAHLNVFNFIIKKTNEAIRN